MQTLGGTPGFDFHYETTEYSNGTNSSLYVEVKVVQTLAHLNTISTSKGDRVLGWYQSHEYLNGQNITANGRNETLALDFHYNTTSPPAIALPDEDVGTDGVQGIQFDGVNFLSFFQAYNPSSDETVVNSTMYALIDQGEGSNGQRALDNLVYPSESPVGSFSPYYVTRQNGSSFYIWNNTYYEDAGPIDPADGSVGATEQLFDFQRYVSSPLGRPFVNYTRRAIAEDGYEPRLVVDEIGTGWLEIPPPQIVHGDGVNELPADSWDDWF